MCPMITHTITLTNIEKEVKDCYWMWWCCCWVLCLFCLFVFCFLVVVLPSVLCSLLAQFNNKFFNHILKNDFLFLINTVITLWGGRGCCSGH